MCACVDCMQRRRSHTHPPVKALTPRLLPPPQPTHLCLPPEGLNLETQPGSLLLGKATLAAQEQPPHKVQEQQD